MYFCLRNLTSLSLGVSPYSCFHQLLPFSVFGHTLNKYSCFLHVYAFFVLCVYEPLHSGRPAKYTNAGCEFIICHLKSWLGLVPTWSSLHHKIIVGMYIGSCSHIVIYGSEKMYSLGMYKAKEYLSQMEIIEMMLYYSTCNANKKMMVLYWSMTSVSVVDAIIWWYIFTNNSKPNTLILCKNFACRWPLKVIQVFAPVMNT